MLLVLLILGVTLAVGVIGTVCVIVLALRCRSCGKLPIASRADGGWPFYDEGYCPYCGARR